MRLEVLNATIDEIDEITLLLKRCFNEMEYEESGYSFDSTTIKEQLSYWIKHGIVVITKHQNIITGIGIVFIVPTFMDKHNIHAIEAAWHSDPSLLTIQRGRIMYALLNKMEVETKKRGIRFLHVSTSILFPFNKKMFAKRGYNIVEFHHLKEVI